MQHYTDEDVYVAWCPGGKHFKKRQNLYFIDYNDPDKFFMDALREHKGIVCLVGTIQRLNHYSAPRYQLDIRVGVRRYDSPMEKTLEGLKNYWRLWGWGTPPDVAELAAAYHTAPFVSTAILPCTKRKVDNELQPVAEDLREPRVALYPPFGKEYIVGLDKSLKTQNLADWAHNINAAVQKVYKLFVDSDGELV
jgi:hypothetical protein